MSRFEMLGAQEIKKPELLGKSDPWIATVATLAGGTAGALLWRKHQVLGLLNGFAVGGNVARVATKEITLRRAAENLGAHVVATASSLGLPSHPAIGYVAGAAGANLFLRREDTYLERLDETLLGREYRDVIGTSWTVAPSLDSVRTADAVIKKGQKGDSVLYVQALVGDSAYAEKGFQADSEFGDATEKAVKKFQSAKGINPNGIVDNVTMAALDGVAGGSGSGVSVLDFTKPATKTNESKTEPKSTALVPVAKNVSPSGDKAVSPEETLIFGQPAWKAALIGVGVLLASSGVYLAVK